jgi:hypothetical protein
MSVVKTAVSAAMDRTGRSANMRIITEAAAAFPTPAAELVGVIMIWVARPAENVDIWSGDVRLVGVRIAKTQRFHISAGAYVSAGASRKKRGY